MKPFVYIAVIVLAGLLGFGLCATLDRWRDQAPPTWRAEQDSLRAELENEKIAHLNDLKLYTDSLKAYTDSAVQAMPPAPVVKERAWKFFEFAPLGTAVDTLRAE